MSSPTAKSLALLRKEGFTACVVEKYNKFARVRNDAFGYGDILCFKDGITMLVQTTTAANVMARIDKIKAMKTAIDWAITTDVRLIEIHGWGLYGKKGKRKLYRCRRFELDNALRYSDGQLNFIEVFNA